MELRHFRYALAIAAEGSFTRAAERLHVAQQGLSQQIADLEREVGVKLFERLPRGVRPTPAGAAFLAHARAILAESDSAVAEARSLVRGHRGLMRVGFPLTGTVETDSLLARFRWRHPGVEIELNQVVGDPAPALQEGRLDVVLGFTPAGADGLVEEVIATAQMSCVFLPAGHALATRETVWLRELEDTPMLLAVRDASPYAHDRLLAQLAERGLRPRRADLRVHGPPTVSLVAVTQAWLLWFDGADPAPGTARCRIADPPVSLDIWLLWRRDARSAMVEQFVTSCREDGRAQLATPLSE